MQASYKTQMAVITLIVSIGFMGIALPYPILTPMILQHTGNIIIPAYLDFISKSLLLGITLCVYPLGQFFGSPILGGISDIIGRKLILIIALLGTAVGYFLSGFAITEHFFGLLLFSRLFTGFCEGNISIAQASAADLSNNVKKIRSFSLINGAVALGYIIGPIFGGFLADKKIIPWFSYSLPFYAAMVLAIISALLVYKYFEETWQNKYAEYTGSTKKISQAFSKSIKNIFTTIKIPQLKRALLVYIVLFAGIDLFYEYYPLFFVGNWQFSAFDIAWFSIVYTIPYALSQAFIVPHLGCYFSSKNILKKATLFCGSWLILLLVFSNYLMLYITLPILGVLMAFCSTNIAILVSDSADENMQGSILGVSQSLRVLNNVVIAISGGILAIVAASTPLLIGGAAIIIAGLLLF
jgi:MFS family permease